MPQGIKCPSCQAPADGTSAPAVCAHCGTRFYWDAYGSYVPLIITASISEDQAVEKIRQWASSVRGGHEFSRNMELARMSLEYYPLYVFSRSMNGSACRTVAVAVPQCEPGITVAGIVPAALSPISPEAREWRQCIQPSIGPGAYGKLMDVDASSRSLVFYPFWCTQYVYRGKLNKVTVDAFNGRVSGDLNVEIEKRSPLPVAAAFLIALTAEGMLSYLSWILAAAAIACTCGYACFTAFRRRQDS